MILDELIHPNCLVFDIGANIGKMTDRFLDRGATVVAVEPQDFEFRHLRQKYRYHDKVILLNVACSSDHLGVDFYTCRQVGTISTCQKEWTTDSRFAEDGYEWNPPRHVPSTTLDALVAIYGTPSFTKIDVEGFEETVLRGLTKPLPCLSFEFTEEFPLATMKCLRYLAGLGPIECNVSVNDSPDFALSSWVSYTEVVAKLPAFPMHGRQWGDIYVRSV